MENTIIDFILIGEVGIGKSSLLNFLFGKKLVNEFHGRKDNQIKSLNGLTIIETLGINDNFAHDYNNVHKYLVLNIGYVKNFRAILFVLHYGC